MLKDFDEEVAVRCLPRWWTRRSWEWQIWRTVESETRWGDSTTRRAVVAHGRCRTREAAEQRGRDALVSPADDELLDRALSHLYACSRENQGPSTLLPAQEGARRFLSEVDHG